MQGHIRKGIVAAAAALALGAVPAPAYASVETDHCLEPPYTAELVVYCGCVAMAGGLSPVIPPETWSCNPPG